MGSYRALSQFQSRSPAAETLVRSSVHPLVVSVAVDGGSTPENVDLWVFVITSEF